MVAFKSYLVVMSYDIADQLELKPLPYSRYPLQGSAQFYLPEYAYLN